MRFVVYIIHHPNFYKYIMLLLNFQFFPKLYEPFNNFVFYSGGQNL